MKTNIIKYLSSVAVGAGTSYGGVKAYYGITPKTIKELLIKNGEYQIFSENDGDRVGNAISHDQKENQKMKDELKTSDKLKNWCLETALNKIYKSDEEKNEVEILCTSKGIKSIEALFIANSMATKDYDQHKFIKNEDEAKQIDLYKEVFAVNRFSKDFLDWINEPNTDPKTKLDFITKVDEGYTVLKKKCEGAFKEEFKDNVHKIKYVDGGCRNPEQETIDGRVKKNYRYKKEKTNGDDVLKTWYGTERVMGNIRHHFSKSTGDPLGEDDFKKYCQENMNKKINEEDAYKETFVTVKSVCYETKYY